jgi:hypothetical protein
MRATPTAREDGSVRTRPTAGQWVRYALGGRLPAGVREWVRHDLTDAGWRGREILRVLVQCAVPVAVLAVLPADAELRLLMIALVVLGAVFVAAAYGDELRDRRLRQHGLSIPRRPDA